MFLILLVQITVTVYQLQIYMYELTHKENMAFKMMLCIRNKEFAHGCTCSAKECRKKFSETFANKLDHTTG